MTLTDIRTELERLSDGDCHCDTKAPWGKCLPCIAAGVLNESAEVLRNGYDEILGEMKK